MSANPIYIEKHFIIGHIEDVDLTDLPDISYGIEVSKPRLIGYINYYWSYDDFAFGITNNYGVDSNATPIAPVQLYIDKHEWIDEKDIQENKWIVFELCKQTSRNRHKALSVRYIRPNLEDYTIAKNYIKEYAEVRGQIQGNGYNQRINENIEEALTKIFFSTAEGKQLILNDLYQNKSKDSYEWKKYLSHLTQEEKESFVLDETQIKPTAELRIAMTTELNKVDLLKHPSVIAYLNTNSYNEPKVIEEIISHLKSEEKNRSY